MAQRSRMKDFVSFRNMRPAPSQPEASADNTPLVAKVEETSVTIDPPWTQNVEEARQEMGKIRTKIVALQELHQTALKPTFDMDETKRNEMEVELETKEITTMFHNCQRIIATIKKLGSDSNSQQQERVTVNIVHALASELQTLSGEFKGVQARFLKRMRAQETSPGPDDDPDEDYYKKAEEREEKAFTGAQEQAIQDNTRLIQERDEEIEKIVNSITELARIFQDLSSLIIDQGSMLDRIDYNLEVAAYHVSRGKEELVEGEKLQKKAAKKMVIVALVLLVILFIFLMIFTHRQTSS
eukprot:m.13328 g.13328  ORF g.13328 m.13328 type:complete len:298 (+) comp2814_c0_seq1:45-938(+)